jgi:hypothetical protein
MCDFAGSSIVPSEYRKIVDRPRILQVEAGRQISRIQIGTDVSVRRVSEALQGAWIFFIDVDDAPALDG